MIQTGGLSVVILYSFEKEWLNYLSFVIFLYSNSTRIICWYSAFEKNRNELVEMGVRNKLGLRRFGITIYENILLCRNL
jgi:hypothetical protein